MSYKSNQSLSSVIEIESKSELNVNDVVFLLHLSRSHALGLCRPLPLQQPFSESNVCAAAAPYVMRTKKNWYEFAGMACVKSCLVT